jgi:hypothetical protein
MRRGVVLVAAMMSSFGALVVPSSAPVHAAPAG